MNTVFFILYLPRNNLKYFNSIIFVLKHAGSQKKLQKALFSPESYRWNRKKKQFCEWLGFHHHKTS